MNWRENIHLFLTGKFFFTYKHYKKEHPLNLYIPAGIDSEEPKPYLSTGLIYSDYEGYGLDQYYLEDCKLVARPISDMTDQEVLSIAKKVDGTPESVREIWNFKANTEPDNLSLGAIKHMLKHGVFPGSQTNPEGVIWKYENKKSK